MKQHATPVDSHITSYTPAWKHLVWTLVTSPKHALSRLLNPVCQRTCVLFRTHAITFFHSDAIHSGGISQECQWCLFFPFAPIFCDGKNYSPPWQITIKSIRKEQECPKQNRWRGAGGGGPVWRCLTISFWTGKLNMTLVAFPWWQLIHFVELCWNETS